jgi:MarR family transcriptional regulator, 2-MHQ and catechol-resistance regulon repressor
MASLKTEIKQNKEFSSIEEEVLLNLMRTSDQVNIHQTRLLRTYGLTAPQYNILRILRGESPLPCLEVASRMITVVPAITGLMDRLEKQGFVIRHRSAEDRRVVLAQITKTGLQLLTSMDKEVKESTVSLLKHMPKKELHEFNRLLELARKKCLED